MIPLQPFTKLLDLLFKQREPQGGLYLNVYQSCGCQVKVHVYSFLDGVNDAIYHVIVPILNSFRLQ